MGFLSHFILCSTMSTRISAAYIMTHYIWNGAQHRIKLAWLIHIVATAYHMRPDEAGRAKIELYIFLMGLFVSWDIFI